MNTKKLFSICINIDLYQNIDDYQSKSNQYYIEYFSVVI